MKVEALLLQTQINYIAIGQEVMQEQVLVLAVMVVAEVEVLDLHLPAVLYTQHSQHVLIMQNGYN